MRGLMSAGAAAARALVMACCLLGLAACSTSGRSFQSSALWQVVPGQTTVGQASDILGCEPVNIYRRMDGSLIARWAHSASLVTDAVYFRQELWLEFGSDGKFERVVKKVNIPVNAHVAVESPVLAPSVLPAPASVPPPAVSASWTQPLTDSAVAYPLN